MRTGSIVHSGISASRSLHQARAHGFRLESFPAFGLTAANSQKASIHETPAFWQRKPCFWKTVNRAAFGEKPASVWTRAWGLLKYPFQLLKHAVLWVMGSRSGFISRHPLSGLTEGQLIEQIGALNRQIGCADLRLNFSQTEMEKAQLTKRQLLKICDVQMGAQELLAAKDWPATAVALERFLSGNGKNNSESCANVSFAHAQKLSSGSYSKRLKLKNAEVSSVDWGDGLIDRIFLPNPAYRAALNQGFKGMTEQQIEALIKTCEQALIDKLRLTHPLKRAENVSQIEFALKAAGNGAQVFVFDVKKKDGHVSLAVNIQNRFYHIDNLDSQSAKVSDLRKWVHGKQPDGLWYAISKDPVHPSISQG